MTDSVYTQDAYCAQDVCVYTGPLRIHSLVDSETSMVDYVYTGRLLIHKLPAYTQDSYGVTGRLYVYTKRLRTQMTPRIHRTPSYTQDTFVYIGNLHMQRAPTYTPDASYVGVLCVRRCPVCTYRRMCVYVCASSSSEIKQTHKFRNIFYGGPCTIKLPCLVWLFIWDWFAKLGLGSNIQWLYSFFNELCQGV